jgi:protein-tyrosine kinase
VNLVTAISQKSKISEQYRTIRTNFLSSINGLNYETIVITSPKSGDGKSTTAANFAVTLAQQGKKVLLIDADLRNPGSALQSAFNIGNFIGLSNVLIGRNLIEDAIYHTDIRGLDLLPSGHVPHNPAELLGSKSMDKVIDNVKKNYDVVIFDTPPVFEVSDAKIIANKCEGLILVLRWGKTKNEDAIEAKRLLESASAKLLGVILNDKT